MDEQPTADRGADARPLARSTPLAFIGRRQQLAWFDQCVEETRAGAPRVVLLGGDAGIGKTRLLKEVCASASQQGFRISYGRCQEERALSYLPFVEELSVALAEAPDLIRAHLATESKIIQDFLRPPDAARLTVGHSLASQMTDQDRGRLFMAVARAAMTLARQTPLLIAVDDLHWADEPSLDLFGRIAFALADATAHGSLPCLLIGAYRTIDTDERLGNVLARLQREAVCQTLQLDGLEEEDMRALLQHLGLPRPAQQLLGTIGEATRGNPLFMQEIVHHLQHHGALQKRGGYLVTTAPITALRLPEHTLGAVGARAQALAEDCRRVLTFAAFLGEQFSLEILSMVSGMSEDGLLDVLEEAIRHRLLQEEPEGFQFAHPLIRHVFYNLPSVARRQRVHRQIARALEQLYAPTLEAHALEIAQHLISAGPVAEADKVCTYGRLAGHRAQAAFAWSDAARYYEAALDAAAAGGTLTPQERAELHYLAGHAHCRNQDVGPAFDHYERAIVAYRQSDDVCGLAQALMEKTRLHYTLMSVPFGTRIDLEPLEAVLEDLGERAPALRGSIAAIMAEAYWTARETNKAEAMARHALAIGSAIHDDALCTFANFALGLSYTQRMHIAEALASWEQALVFARRTTELSLHGLPLPRIPLALMTLGRLDTAETVALEACEVTRQTQDWGYHSLALSHLTAVEVARGHFTAAERRAHETALMASRSHYPWGETRSSYALACAHALRGAWSAAEAVLDSLIAEGHLFPRPGEVAPVFVRVFRRLLHALAEHPSGEALEPLAADLQRVVGSDTYSLAPLCAMVELSDLLAAPGLVDFPLQRLTCVFERGILFSSGWVFLLPRVLGVAATIIGEWDNAETYFQAALESAKRTGAQPELGRTALDYARMLSTRGREQDVPRAVDFAQQAQTLCASLGMHPFVQQATRLLETLQRRYPLAFASQAQMPLYAQSLQVRLLLPLARAVTSFLR